MSYLDAFLDAVYAVRWILVFLAAIAAGALLADANSRADIWREWAEDLEAENDELRSRLRPPIIALPPRDDTEEVRRG